MAEHYDVIIVGSGAGGGTLAHRLAPSGKRVLILERGDWLPREVQNWDAEAVFVDNRYVSADQWFDDKGKPFQPQVHYFVGGATKFYGAALYRLRERDFGELNLQMVGKSSAPMYRGEKPVESVLAPTFALRDVAEHAVDFWLSAEDLPDPDNRVTLDRDGNVVLSYTPNNHEPMEQLYHRVKKHLSRLGMHPHHLIPRNVYMKNDIPVAGCAHQAGTVRFGRDPATSVLDTDCKAHEVDNLYVVDTSFFPSIGAVNPALTAIANALRVGDHLLERLG